MYGFGGKPKFIDENTKVSHCFPLTGSVTNPMVQGIQGVLGAYRSTLPNIKLSGPTYFDPILQEFKSHCAKTYGKPIYNVLLIITDGEIHDMAKTKEILAQLSVNPCSVIIIGVGEEEFDAMKVLDGDGPDKLPGAERDIV